MPSFGTRSHKFRPPRKVDQLEMRVMAGRQVGHLQLSRRRFIPRALSRLGFTEIPEHRSAHSRKLSFGGCAVAVPFGFWRPLGGPRQSTQGYAGRDPGKAPSHTCASLRRRTGRPPRLNFRRGGLDFGVWLRSFCLEFIAVPPCDRTRWPLGIFLPIGDVAEGAGRCGRA